MKTKNQIREWVKLKKRELDSEAIKTASIKISDRISALKVFQSAETVFLYASFKSEVQMVYLADAAKKAGKKTAYPKINPADGAMDFYSVEHFEELKANDFKSMHIYEPDPSLHQKVTPGLQDIIIVPGLAFARDGSRVGYGGGYYDRYLVKYPPMYTIGAAMEFQLFDELPSESFDIKMDYTISEQQVICHFNENSIQ